jgi:hypothetical protein
MRRFFLTIAVSAPVALTACQTTPPSQANLLSPYGNSVVIAVPPSNNLTGIAHVDGAAFADRLVAQLQNTRGVTALPVNRTIDAMASLEMSHVATPQDASALARFLDADAVLISTVNAWTPYEPLQLGVSAVLFAESSATSASGPDTMDPALIQAAWSDESFIYSPTTTAPVAAAAHHFDAAGYATQTDVRRYAEGRFDEQSALGWKRYIRSMNDFETFGAFALVESVLNAERERVREQHARSEGLRQAQAE